MSATSLCAPNLVGCETLKPCPTRGRPRGVLVAFPPKCDGYAVAQVGVGTASPRLRASRVGGGRESLAPKWVARWLRVYGKKVPGLGRGCGNGVGTESGNDASQYSIVIEPVEPDWEAPLPPEICYVAARGYEVELTTRSERRPISATALQSSTSRASRDCAGRRRTCATRMPRRAWSVCSQMMRAAWRSGRPADSGRPDADAICEALVKAGWHRRPPL